MWFLFGPIHWMGREVCSWDWADSTGRRLTHTIPCSWEEGGDGKTRTVTLGSLAARRVEVDVPKFLFSFSFFGLYDLWEIRFLNPFLFFLRFFFPPVNNKSTQEARHFATICLGRSLGWSQPHEAEPPCIAPKTCNELRAAQLRKRRALSSAFPSLLREARSV